MGWRIYRTIVFVPYILAIPVLGTTFIYLLSLDGGLNSLLRDIGLGFLAQDWFGSPSWVLPSIAAIIIYHELGFGVVLFLARLLSLPEEVDQAARIDGCNWWQLRRQITLPQMTGVITAFVTLELINMLSWVFAYVYSTTKGGPELRELRHRALHLRQRIHVPGSELRGRRGASCCSPPARS